MNTSKRFTKLALTVTLSVLAGWLLSAAYTAPQGSTSVQAQAKAMPADLTPEESRNIAIFQNASPSVVFITSLTVNRNPFSMDVTDVPAGTGSGLVWDSEGHIVTNFHVIQEANAATVTLADQSTWPAELVGVEPDKDLAVLKIKAPTAKLKPLQLGTSSDLRVGQNVYAIGNPFGLDQTLTTGIISGLGRQIQSVTHRPILGVIQTDAAINPGNSGGPLLDSSGRVIGINTAIFSPSGASAGVGFAVPIDNAKRLVPQIIQFGHARRPGLGVMLGPDHLARQLGIPGIIVTGIAPNTPAQSAGFVPAHQDNMGNVILGDVITKVDGKPVQTGDQLYLVLDKYQPGDTVTVTVLRDRKTVDLRVKLADLSSI